jgi:hypothetical protein
METDQQTSEVVKIERPIGLTVLAVLNFMYAAFFLLLYGILLSSSNPDISQTDYKQIIMFSVLCGLLVASGIGYLKMSRWGYFLGNLYVAFQLFGLIFFLSVFGLRMIRTQIPGLIYPAATFVFLNFRYRTCFAPPTNRAR